ncbi:TIGR03086 family metal-binding protein [Nocardia yamanashiensis]|uniref:TIGR03086 family metal-binding protein n=1 Tax=Nocardia yamanashiensis TaxID=209247 RepID=UPI0008341D78|nr:TIGR03086 family metal-binding protein [Nocardia yamanashiensis]
MGDTSRSDPTVDLVERAVAQLGDVIAAVRPDQAGLPTPCQEWRVGRLLDHLVGQDLPAFTTAARGEDVDWASVPHEEIDADWSAEFEVRSGPLLDAWRAGDLDRPVRAMGGTGPLRGRADQQIAEFAMHTWDLARATGQQPELDPELAERALAWSKRLLRPEYRGPGKAFGPEVPIPADAPAYDRLAAWFGRDPHWHASASA